MNNTTKNKLEVWLRGPLSEVPALLQPIAHALLQAREEVNELMESFPNELLWEKPANVASVGFHLQHLSGVLDRLFTYAEDKSLNEKQLQLLALENKFPQQLTTDDLLTRFNNQVEISIKKIRAIDESKLLEVRGVGRAKIPSTMLGLMFHSAEHTMRHVGQLTVTVRLLMNNERNKNDSSPS